MTIQVQSSFRKFLLSRILVLTLPVLILGQYLIYRQARSTLLDTARQNLKESADRKAEDIQQWAKALESNLISASQSYIFESSKTEDYQNYVEQLHKMLPRQVSCVQLSNLQTKQIVANSCNSKLIHSLPENIWPQQQKQVVGENNNIYISCIKPEQLNSKGELNDGEVNEKTQVSLGFTVPIYVTENGERKLQYALSIKSALPMQTDKRRGSLTGSTVIIDNKGTILATPYPSTLGHNISEQPDGKRLESIIKNAQEGQKDFAHIFSFKETDIVSRNRENDGSKNSLREIIDNLEKILPELLGLKLSADNEFLAGYVAIPSPVERDNNSQWIVLAITPIDFAISGLKEVQKVLIVLVFVLVVASIVASIYLARDLARPLEKLRDYAVTVNNLESPNKVPRNLKINEFNQLAISLEKMVGRLKNWANQLEVTSKEAQVANQLKSEFLANISHELRTPLNGIIGSLQLVRDDFCDSREEEIEYVEQANNSAIHLLGIINDILDIRKLDSGTLSLTVQDVNIINLLKETVDSFRDNFQEKSLLFNLNILPQIIIVNADEEKLKQVFENIISNAIKFTEKGGINISISLQYNELSISDNFLMSDHGQRINEVLVKIQDTGIGIDLEQQDKLFQPFVMVDGTTTRKFGGNGLGLAISRRLMEIMKGDIRLYSEGINQGTTVNITMPIKEILSSESSEEKLYVSTKVKL
ncbi:ATP-binding protein [Okeania sp.]|uniref:sensor histidine kinase n=1 Tax=Okeania sp. TaxID=3100323 RepID=UPI002B4AC75B|nr:ATP-binding protein [Okeania sp.]MEB3339483.1 ATP-binding protein [Okeania sp.]